MGVKAIPPLRVVELYVIVAVLVVERFHLKQPKPKSATDEAVSHCTWALLKSRFFYPVEEEHVTSLIIVIIDNSLICRRVVASSFHFSLTALILTSQIVRPLL